LANRSKKDYSKYISETFTATPESAVIEKIKDFCPDTYQAASTKHPTRSRHFIAKLKFHSSPTVRKSPVAPAKLNINRLCATRTKSFFGEVPAVYATAELLCGSFAEHTNLVALYPKPQPAPHGSVPSPQDQIKPKHLLIKGRGNEPVSPNSQIYIC
jgi:hypothetical protein